MSNELNKKIKILFLIHDLGHGGAEKVLINLLNNMDRSLFDISLISLFGGGVNERFLNKDIHYHAVFPIMFRGNKHLMKLLTPRQLHTLIVKETYDIEVSYLEGPSARIISGCPCPDTKLVTWIHTEFKDSKMAKGSFRSFNEAVDCYSRFDRIISVSEHVKNAFAEIFPIKVRMQTLYNTNESDDIKRMAEESVDSPEFSTDDFKLVCVGKLTENKGFDRVIKIVKRLRDEQIPVHLFILGSGEQRNKIERCISENTLSSNVTLLGYQTNPYKYISKCDLFVCSSYREGFSTAATEALIIGVPVCTVEVSGMKEMLGTHDEWGVVAENDDDVLYSEIRKLILNPERLLHYRNKALERGSFFSKQETVKAVEKMLISL